MTATVGILGGMGPLATVDFYRRLTESTRADNDQGHLHVIIDSYPPVPDRTAFLLGCGEDPLPALIAMAHRLEAMQVGLMVMPCNTASALIGRLAESVDVPVVDWVAETAAGVAKRIPEATTVGLLATEGTCSSGIYQRGFAAHGIHVVLPAQELQEAITRGIYGVKSGATTTEAVVSTISTAVESLADVGAQVALLACTELSLCAAGGLPGLKLPWVDASQVVAERTVELAGVQVRPFEQA